MFLLHGLERAQDRRRQLGPEGSGVGDARIARPLAHVDEGMPDDARAREAR
ncbi:MAG: hypothetical protein IT577_14585 [Verrucomicrobiae bacterium]|nr:hypothetical protein [Verrucomicrobiae bacterium]